MTIKAAAAEQAGRSALQRLTGGSATRARALAVRMVRHSLAANAALEHAAAALSGIEAGMTPVATTASEPGGAPALRLRRLRAPLVGAGAFLFVGLLLAPAWLDWLGATQPSREGTLGGTVAGPPSEGDNATATTIATPPLASVAGDGQGGVRTPEDAVLVIDFDEVRMGSGIGAEWRQTAGEAAAVALAAFPTGVNRSARLGSIGGAGAEACLSLPSTTLRVTRLIVDVLLPEEPVTAVVSVGDATGDLELRMGLSTSGSAVGDGTRGVLAEGDVLEAGAWYRAEIAADGQRMIWRVAALGGPSEPVFERAFDTGPLEAVGEVCMSVSNEAAGEVHFDNLTIVTNEEG